MLSRVLVAVLLIAAVPARAQEEQPSPDPAAVPEAQPMPAPAPVPEVAPAPAPEAAPAKAEGAAKDDKAGPTRRYGALAVFGIASIAVGIMGGVLSAIAISTALLFSPSMSPIDHNTAGIPLGTTGTSLNPFMAFGAVALAASLVLGAAGAVMLGLEMYLNERL